MTFEEFKGIEMTIETNVELITTDELEMQLAGKEQAVEEGLEINEGSKITFEEFKEKAKEVGATVSSGMVIYKSVKFLENGEIETDGRIFSAYQMYNVLEALKKDNEEYK